MSFTSRIGRGIASACSVALLLSAGALLAAPTAAQAATSTTFHYTGQTDTYTVPAGIEALSVKLVGGTGGDPLGGGQGQGGIVTFKLPVTPGQQLTVSVGANGVAGTPIGTPNPNGLPATFGGGGGTTAGTQQGGSGGGASEILDSSSNVLAVAGGGGGGGSQVWCGSQGSAYGGNAGYPSGADGYETSCTGTQVGGGGGTQSAGGVGGDGSPWSSPSGTAGSLGQGGTAGSYSGYYSGGGRGRRLLRRRRRHHRSGRRGRL